MDRCVCSAFSLIRGSFFFYSLDQSIKKSKVAPIWIVKVAPVLLYYYYYHHHFSVSHSTLLWFQVVAPAYHSEGKRLGEKFRKNEGEGRGGGVATRDTCLSYNFHPVIL